MEVVLYGILIIIGCALLPLLILRFFNRKSRDNGEEDFTDPDEEYHNTPTAPTPQPSGRQFTLAELRQAEAGKYSWDETGCVFEINSDGSVTVVGHFDPAELVADPILELYGRMEADGLPDMLPRIWSMYVRKAENEPYRKFILASGNEYMAADDFGPDIADIKEIDFCRFEDDALYPMTDLLLKANEAHIILMPCNEKEFILSLGAQAYITRIFEGRVRVRISSPAVMGAFWSAINSNRISASNFSFAFGSGDDYRCCNMISGDGVYEVQQLLTSSIIQPADELSALDRIARGCITQFLILEGNIKNVLLLGMLPCTMSLLLKENGRVIKIYDIIGESIAIPIRREEKDITISPGNTVSFLIGENELIEDLISEYGIPYGSIDISIESYADMNIILKIKASGRNYEINIGNLIG